jgi:hypothetical protein
MSRHEVLATLWEQYQSATGRASKKLVARTLARTSEETLERLLLARGVVIPEREVR